MDLRNQHNIDPPRCRGGYLEDVPEWVWGHKDQVIEPKMDGERLTMEIGEIGSILQGRNRQDFLKGVARAKDFRIRNEVNPDLAAIACKELAGTLLDGELTDLRVQDGGLHADTIRMQAEGEFIGYTVWQVFFWKGKDVRHMPDQYRRQLAQESIKILKSWNAFKKKIGFAPQKYVNKIRLIERRPATLENLNKFIDKGLEGAVIKDKSKPIPKDKNGKFQRTNTFWWKCKGDERRTVDAFIIGVTEATDGGSGVNDIARKPNGKAATFTMAMMGVGLDEGPVAYEVAKMSNLPDDAVENGFKHFKRYTGKVVEMQVSGWDGERFRWPRFKKLRPDKTYLDCQMAEQIGEQNGKKEMA